MQKLLLLFLFFFSSAFAGEITIAVAANVSYAIKSLTKEFNKDYPDTKVRVILGSSGKLTAQVSHGAPYQLFMSADMKYPEALYKDSIAITKPRIYARGSLAYISAKKRDFSLGMKLLQNDNIRKIAVANPHTAPYGIAAAQAMKHSGVYQSLKPKFVYGESISQTLSYAISATDIGLIAKSSFYSPKLAQYKKGVHWAEVDPSLYTPINQGIVILKEGHNNQEVTDFYQFMLSPKAHKVLSDFGYLIP